MGNGWANDRALWRFRRGLPVGSQKVEPPAADSRRRNFAVELPAAPDTRTLLCGTGQRPSRPPVGRMIAGVRPNLRVLPWLFVLKLGSRESPRSGRHGGTSGASAERQSSRRRPATGEPLNRGLTQIGPSAAAEPGRPLSPLQAARRAFGSTHPPTTPPLTPRRLSHQDCASSNNTNSDAGLTERSVARSDGGPIFLDGQRHPSLARLGAPLGRVPGWEPVGAWPVSRRPGGQPICQGMGSSTRKVALASPLSLFVCRSPANLEPQRGGLLLSSDRVSLAPPIWAQPAGRRRPGMQRTLVLRDEKEAAYTDETARVSDEEANPKKWGPRKWPNKRAFSVAALLSCSRPQRLSSSGKSARGTSERSAHGYSDGSSSLSFELPLTQPKSEPASREIHGYKPSFLSDRVSDEASWVRGRPRKQVVERSAGRATPSGRRASQDAQRNPACVVSVPVVHSVSNSPVAEAALRARDNPGERRSDVGGGLSLGARWEGSDEPASESDADSTASARRSTLAGTRADGSDTSDQSENPGSFDPGSERAQPTLWRHGSQAASKRTKCPRLRLCKDIDF
ncbi:hypothetical protein ISCGN_012988 [Ixodes scapularis]